MIPYRESFELRKPGGWEGKVRMSDDFDDELPPANPFDRIIIAQAICEKMNIITRVMKFDAYQVDVVNS